MHTRIDVLRASSEWVWLPRGCDHETTDLQLVRYPARFGGGVRGSRVESSSDAASVLDRAIERTRAWGERELTFWTNESDSPDLEQELQARGAEHIDTVAVFAQAIAGISVPVPEDAVAEIIRTEAQIRRMDAVNVAVWGQKPLDDEGILTELAETTRALKDRSGLRVLAALDGQPVSTGGCTVVDGFVRLWGAATIESARGRGAYRAVLAERLRASAEFGATTAIVKGRVSTSAPILARVGFEHFGDERAYRLEV